MTTGSAARAHPKPDALAFTGGYELIYKDAQLLALHLYMSVDIGMAHLMVQRDDIWLLDLARGGRELPLSEVIDRQHQHDAWTSAVQAVMSQHIPNDATAAEVVANYTVDTDSYAVSKEGILLCPVGLPSAFLALQTCDYVLTWRELAPFWIAGNPLERVKRLTNE